MLKKNVSIIIAGLLLVFSAFGQEKSALPKTDFSGTWVLDKTKTKNLPTELESYVIKILQNTEKIAIRTDVKGDIQMRRGRGKGESGGEGDSGERSGRSGGGGGRGGRSGGGGFGGGAPSLNGRMALANYFSDVIFTLDEKEVSVDIKQDEAIIGKTKLKMKWKKDGKILETTVTREFEQNGQKLKIPTREKWELSDEGKTLKISREISTPMVTDSINLVFTKQAL